VSHDYDEPILPRLARRDKAGLGPRHRTEAENAKHREWMRRYVEGDATASDALYGCRCPSCRNERNEPATAESEE
jgi:hypothetical protein